MRPYFCILNLKSRAGSKKYLCMAWEPLFACSKALLSCLSSGRIVLSQQSSVHKHFLYTSDTTSADPATEAALMSAAAVTS